MNIHQKSLLLAPVAHPVPAPKNQALRPASPLGWCRAIGFCDQTLEATFTVPPLLLIVQNLKLKSGNRADTAGQSTQRYSSDRCKSSASWPKVGEPIPIQGYCFDYGLLTRSTSCVPLSKRTLPWFDRTSEPCVAPA